MFVKGELLIKLGDLQQAQGIYRDLIKRNPENHYYYKQLEMVLKLGNM